MEKIKNFDSYKTSSNFLSHSVDIRLLSRNMLAKAYTILFIQILWWVGLLAKTHEFDFDVSYIKANPDGVFERQVIGVNNQWPIPTIRVQKNDRVIIHVTNSLGDKNTSLHFHGLFQQGQNGMDGPEMVTQCPIPPGFTFTYNFTVMDQVGTYWYHSHSGNQYGDGLRGMFIIEDDAEEIPFSYDEEVTLTVSDWYHKLSGDLMTKFLSRYNPTGAEPVPQNALFNDTRNATWIVRPNTTYFMRIANMGLFTSQYLAIEDHKFTIVEVDGVYVKPYEVDFLYVAVAQRYGVIITTKDSTDKNFRFLNIIDKDMLDVLPSDLYLISTNYVQYNKDVDLPGAIQGSDEKKYDDLVESLGEFDEFDLTPLNEEALLDDPDYQITLDFTMDNLGDGINYAFFNDISYTAPKVPTLYTVMSSGKFSNEAKIYGSNTNTFVLQKDEVVEIVLNNQDPGKHPFHLHGHNFQVLKKSEEGDDDDNPITYDPENPEQNKFPEFPLIRDTILVNPNGFIVIRFKANNPGVWFFHCHVDWHLEQGLAITLVEAPELIQNQLIPENHFDSCKAGDIDYIGNAAGNFGDDKEAWVDLTGERLQSEPLPEGFTLKGYIAFAICTVLAIYGLITICRYGMEDVKADNNDHVIRHLYKILDDYGALDENEGISLNSNLPTQSPPPQST